jgi:hypothetical protein
MNAWKAMNTRLRQFDVVEEGTYFRSGDEPCNVHCVDVERPYCLVHWQFDDLIYFGVKFSFIDHSLQTKSTDV